MPRGDAANRRRSARGAYFLRPAATKMPVSGARLPARTPSVRRGPPSARGCRRSPVGGGPSGPRSRRDDGRATPSAREPTRSPRAPRERFRNAPAAARHPRIRRRAHPPGARDRRAPLCPRVQRSACVSSWRIPPSPYKRVPFPPDDSATACRRRRTAPTCGTLAPMNLTAEALNAYWLPFTANRQFKAAPRLVVQADGMYYTTADGRRILDGFAGLWCCNAGHSRAPIVAAIREQAATMDYAPAFQMSHPLAFELASRIAQLAPQTLDHVFFCNSGSEAVDTALKIALAWHRVRGEGQRMRLIGRERAYHGVGFGGMSVGGISANRRMFGLMLGGIDH